MILPKNQAFPDPFPKGAVLLIDKPLAWTSFDVVNKVRYHLGKRLGIKRYKVGHAGTLDPLATGLLVLCLGDFTKKIESIQSESKAYSGTITFGATTPSYDLEKAPENFMEVDQLTDVQLQGLLPRFVGQIQQLPPVFSAVKVEGKRLYDTARAGAVAELPYRQVRVDSFDLGALTDVTGGVPEATLLGNKGAAIWQHPDYKHGKQCTFHVICGKGVYIRSLAFDLGKAAGPGAYLSSLRRTSIGIYSVNDAWTMDDFMEKCG